MAVQDADAKIADLFVRKAEIEAENVKVKQEISRIIADGIKSKTLNLDFINSILKSAAYW